MEITVGDVGTLVGKHRPGASANPNRPIEEEAEWSDPKVTGPPMTWLTHVRVGSPGFADRFCGADQTPRQKMPTANLSNSIPAAHA
jgi:hypothetical protein